MLDLPADPRVLNVSSKLIEEVKRFAKLIDYSITIHSAPRTKNDIYPKMSIILFYEPDLQVLVSNHEGPDYLETPFKLSAWASKGHVSQTAKRLQDAVKELR